MIRKNATAVNYLVQRDKYYDKQAFLNIFFNILINPVPDSL